MGKKITLAVCLVFLICFAPSSTWGKSFEKGDNITVIADGNSDSNSGHYRFDGDVREDNDLEHRRGRRHYLRPPHYRPPPMPPNWPPRYYYYPPPPPPPTPYGGYHHCRFYDGRWWCYPPEPPPGPGWYWHWWLQDWVRFFVPPPWD